MKNDGFITVTDHSLNQTESFTQAGTKLRIKVLFQFTVFSPKLIYYRGVQASDGSFRMEKRGANAKAYKAFMWCGSEESLFKYRDVVISKDPHISSSR